MHRDIALAFAMLTSADRQRASTEGASTLPETGAPSTPPALNYSRMARLEWYQVIFLTFATPFVQPFMFLFSGDPSSFVVSLITHSIPIFIVTSLLYLVCGFFVASALSGYRVIRSGVKAQPIPSNIRMSIWKSLMAHKQVNSGVTTDQLRMNPADLLMGAHVRGVLSPKIVLSGGLIIGLMRGDPKSLAVLAHEMGHIRHLDLLIPGFIGIALTDIFGLPLQFIVTMDLDFTGFEVAGMATAILLYKLSIMGMFLSLFSRRREFYADAMALQVTRDPEAYISLLSSLSGREKDRRSFFHPSLEKRISEVKNGFKSIRYAMSWRIYLLVATGTSGAIHMYNISQNEDAPFMLINAYTFFAGCFLLVLEMFRSAALRMPLHPVGGQHRSRSTLSYVLFRYAFLLLGFVGATVIGAVIESPEAIPFMGGGVYVIFKVMKRES
jgi:Zn-dependent protease with chaperone function